MVREYVVDVRVDGAWVVQIMFAKRRGCRYAVSRPSVVQILGAELHNVGYVSSNRYFALAVDLVETLLHQAELIGGSAGAFLAQRVFRHKISKKPYLRKFSKILILQVSEDKLQSFCDALQILRPAPASRCLCPFWCN